MDERKKKKMSANQEGDDRISNLPDPLVIAILSLLPTKDAVRCSVLSKRWQGMWRYTSGLSLDQKCMQRKEIPCYTESSVLSYHEKVSRCARIGRYGRDWDPISAASRYIDKVIDDHYDPLTKCRIQHVVESFSDAERWMRKLLVERKVRELSMELDLFYWLDDMTLNVPFEILSGYHVLELKNYPLQVSSPPSFKYPQNLKTLKLTNVRMEDGTEIFFSNCLSLENVTISECNMWIKFKIHCPSVKVLTLERVLMSEIEVYSKTLEVLVLDTVIYRPESLVIIAPNLKVLHCYHDYKFLGQNKLGFPHIRFVRQILEDLCGSVRFEGSSHPSIFNNITSLHTNLSLRNKKDAIALSLVLRSCCCLQNLEIKNQVDERFYASHDDETNAPDIPYPAPMLWRMVEFCECVNKKLKKVCIEGFKGKELEVELVKYLITMSQGMENIIISCDDDCTWEDATATLCLLSFPRNSANLSITLKPGKEYLANVGGSFQKWTLTLN